MTMSRRRTRNNKRNKNIADFIFGLFFIGLALVLTKPDIFGTLVSFILHPFIIIPLLGLFFGFLLIKNQPRQTSVLEKIKTDPKIHHSLNTFSSASQKVTPPHILMNNKEHPSWSLELINKLEWKRFEELCANYFSAKGYRAEVSRQGADGGIDIFLYKDSYSETAVFGIVQCKAWNTYKVGVKPVRELFGVMAAEKAPLGVFITSGVYTKEALNFSEGKPLKLLTGESLLKLIESLPEDEQESLLKQITSGDYTTPSCPSCGTKMIQRKTTKGKNIGNTFWGCANYPRCRNTLKFRQG